MEDSLVRNKFEASRGLKTLAKELDVCVMALSQLNRVEFELTNVPCPVTFVSLEPSSKMPILSIYRDEYYNPDVLIRGG